MNRIGRGANCLNTKTHSKHSGDALLTRAMPHAGLRPLQVDVLALQFQAAKQSPEVVAERCHSLCSLNTQNVHRTGHD